MRKSIQTPIKSADQALSALNRGIISQTEYDVLAAKDFKVATADTVVIRADGPSRPKALEHMLEDLVTCNFSPIRSDGSLFDNLMVSLFISNMIQACNMQGELITGWPMNYPAAAKVQNPPVVREKAIKEREARIARHIEVISWVIQFIDPHKGDENFHPLNFVKNAYEKPQDLLAEEIKMVMEITNRNLPEKHKKSLAQIKADMIKDEVKSIAIRTTADVDNVIEHILAMADEPPTNWGWDTHKQVLTKIYLKLDQWLLNIEDKLPSTRGAFLSNNVKLIPIIENVMDLVQTEIEQGGENDPPAVLEIEEEQTGNDEAVDYNNGEPAELKFH
jgi:hypothetical protein